MGPWWTRDASGRLEPLDEAWLSAGLHQASVQAGVDHPHWPLWQAELVSGASHAITQTLSPGEVIPKTDLIDRLGTILAQLGQPELAQAFRRVANAESHDPLTEKSSTATGEFPWVELVGPDIAELVRRGWFCPALPAGRREWTGPYQVLHSRFYLPGCPDPARALVRLIQLASATWGEINLVGGALWLEELGVGPGRGLEAFDLLEEGARGLGKRLRLHLPMGPGAAPHHGQMGLFYFGSSQGLREPAQALQRWLVEKGEQVAVTGWIPPEDSGTARDASQALATLADLARPGRSVRVERSHLVPDLLAHSGAGQKSVEAVFGGVILRWEPVSDSNLPEGALDQLVGLAVRAGCRFRHGLRQAGKKLWPSDPSLLWRMGWLLRFEGNWPATVLERLERLALQMAHANEMPLFLESEVSESANLLDARLWRSGTRPVPQGNGPWSLHLDSELEPLIPGMK